MSELIIRPYRHGDGEKIVDLFNYCFGQSRTMALWEWKFLKNPYGHLMVVAELDDRVIVHCGGMPVRFKHGAGEITGWQSVDWMSHNRFRGVIFSRRGAFVRTAEAYFDQARARNNSGFAYGFPGGRHLALGRKIMGYIPVLKICEFKKSLTRIRPTPVDRLRALFKKNTLIPVTRFDQGADELWSRVAPSLASAVIRDQAYLNWRYADKPGFNYDLFQLAGRWGRGRIEAAFVVHREGRVGRLVELVVPPDRLDLIWEVMNHAELFLSRAGVEELVTWLPEQSAAAGYLVGRLGYEKTLI
ncbi:MAG: GNAT family N-acetyltransferase, partial [Deltaproteobacteria bacterium]|nr:GNAT family N-acetyltransferase [Deltaproteobacteria bacterium]